MWQPNGRGSNEHTTPWQPDANIADQIADIPALVVEEKGVHTANVAIHSMYHIAMQLFDTP
jgi:hypothetical protein